MKGLIDKSMGIVTRIAEALARIKPTEPLRSTMCLQVCIHRMLTEWVLFRFIFFPSSPQFFCSLHRMEGTSTEEDLFKREIEDLPVVKSLSFIREIGRNKAGYRVNLFCDAVSLYGGCKD
jgi:hypothetical protein